MEKTRKNARIKGITLIALVITVIVLLILAGISISMLSGDNSILKQAVNAKSSNEEKQERESISLAYNSIMIDKKVKGEATGIIASEFDQAIKNYDVNASATADGRKIIVTFSNDQKYTVYSNGNVTEYSETPYAKDELVVTVSGENVDSPYYVNYPSAKGTIKCRVLYNDSTYGLQLVSINPVTKVTLGKNDPNENVEGEMGSLERAQISYNRAIITLNEKAEEYMATENGSVLAIDARCVGSNPENKNYPNNLTGENRLSEMYVGQEEYLNIYNEKFFKSHNSFSDWKRLGQIGLRGFSDTSFGSYYILAQYFIYNMSGRTFFGLTYPSENGLINHWGLWSVGDGGAKAGERISSSISSNFQAFSKCKNNRWRRYRRNTF